MYNGHHRVKKGGLHGIYCSPSHHHLTFTLTQEPQGHFWEVPTVSGSDAVFARRCLNFFTGTGTREGVGPALNVNLFNAAGSQWSQQPAE